MAKKINATVLRKLVLETVREIETEKQSPSRKQQLTSIVENAITIMEKASPDKVNDDLFPLPLSSALKQGQEAAAEDTIGGRQDGDKDDDVIDATPVTAGCKDLKPSQSSMNIQKAANFALAALNKKDPFPTGPGGDLGAIITADGHIMDGHHRWIASGMIDPSASVGGFEVEFPAKKMIAVLNKITVALGIKSGKEGSGGFDQFQFKPIEAQLKKFAADPGKCWGADGDKDKMLKLLKDFAGGNDEATIIKNAAQKMADNASELTLSLPAGFPERPDMPVISFKKGHLKKAIQMLRMGAVDVNPPYDSNTGQNIAGITPGKIPENKQNNDQLIVERWNRLAGIK